MRKVAILITTIVVFFLSQTPAEARRHHVRHVHTNHGHVHERGNKPADDCPSPCNPFSGAREFQIELEKDSFGDTKEPVPYQGLDWSRTTNPWYDYHMQMLEGLDWVLPKARHRSEGYELLKADMKLNDDYKSLVNPVGEALLLLGFFSLMIGACGYADWRKMRDINVDKE